MTIVIRPYRKADAESAGKLIAATYSEYNLSFVPPAELGAYLGPFQFADSTDEARQKDIIRVLQAQMIYVAETGQGEIVGILRGRKDRLQSLFVRGDWHHQGIGRRLVATFRAGLPGAWRGSDQALFNFLCRSLLSKIGLQKINRRARGMEF